MTYPWYRQSLKRLRKPYPEMPPGREREACVAICQAAKRGVTS